MYYQQKMSFSYKDAMRYLYKQILPRTHISTCLEVNKFLINVIFVKGKFCFEYRKLIEELF